MEDPNVPWEAFEADPLGQLTINGIDYRMRIGFYMGKPIRAILCGDQFVRIQPYIDRWTHIKLEKLEPAIATSCLYKADRTTVRSTGITNINDMTWRPPSWLSYVENDYGFSFKDKNSIINWDLGS